MESKKLSENYKKRVIVNRKFLVTDANLIWYRQKVFEEKKKNNIIDKYKYVFIKTDDKF